MYMLCATSNNGHVIEDDKAFEFSGQVEGQPYGLIAIALNKTDELMEVYPHHVTPPLQFHHLPLQRGQRLKKYNGFGKKEK